MAAIAQVICDGADSSAMLDLVTLDAFEHLGRVYSFRFVALSDRADLAPTQFLGKSFGVRLALQDGFVRHFNGVVLRTGRGRRQGHRHEYWFDVVPDFGLLALRSDARIFQKKTIVDVFRAVASRMPSLAWEFSSGSVAHAPWEYCVQYQESDLNFLLRLLEQEGVYFWFDHLDNAQTKMRLLDDNAVSHQLSAQPRTLAFNPDASRTERPHDFLQEWSRASAIVSGVAELADFDFTRPMQAREVRSQRRVGHAWDELDVFLYPGEFDTRDEGRTYADLRMQEMHARHVMLAGSSTAPDIFAGRVLRIKDHPARDMNGEFLIVSTQYRFINRALDAGEGQGSALLCEFTALPADVQFRPERVTPKPRIMGPQTAFVAGPQGNDIHTDQYGRIRVQFHWDRYGKPTEDASCWVRAVQPWANQGFGFWALPRVGSEVVVQFLDGDPDRPLVTGSVYNSENRIPYPQPSNKTRSGIRTFSSPDGGAGHYSEIRFEDRKGAEEIYVQAQKDMNTRIRNSATRVVGAEDKLSVGASCNANIGKDNTMEIGGQQAVKVGKSNRLQAGGDDVRSIDGDCVQRSASDNVTVQGDALCNAGGSVGIKAGQTYEVSAGMGISLTSMMTVDLKAGLTVAIDAPAGICLSSGPTFLCVTPAGILASNMVVPGGAPLVAMPANPGRALAASVGNASVAIALQEAPPVRPATLHPHAGSLADAARSGAAFATG